MIQVRDIEAALFQWAPKELAAEWDNVGHLVGDPTQEVRRVLVALDITEAVVQEAKAQRADLIVSHHPVMNCTWHKVQSVRTDGVKGRILTQLIRSNISAVCMHTNLDAAEGGVNDILAQKLGLQEVLPFNLEKIGRIGTLKSAIPLVEFIRFVIESLGCSGVRYTDCGKAVHRVAVGGGACGEYMEQVAALGCDTFVTSDLRYHEFLDATSLNLVDAGHFPTENVICPVIAQHLQDAFGALQVVLSQTHCREKIQYCVKEK